jgi:hypothetical protein
MSENTTKKPVEKKPVKAPKIDILGINVVLDDKEAKEALAKSDELRAQLSLLDSKSPEAKAKRKELQGVISNGASRIKTIGSLIYSRAHIEFSLQIKDLKKTVKASAETMQADSAAKIASLKQKQTEIERAIELDKVNALYLLAGKKSVDTNSDGWKWRYGGWRAARPFVNVWNAFAHRFPGLAQFIAFLMVSNGITIIQIILQNIFLPVMNASGLADITFQLWAIPGASCVNIYNNSVYYTQYYVFDYYKGALDSTVIRDGYLMAGGGGLAYFLSVQVTGAIAQVLNFFAQRKVTFKSHGNVWWAAFWYMIAYFVIMIVSSAVQGLYKAPIYQFFISNNLGTFLPNLITMIIYCAISFWIFYPIFKFIFPSDEVLAKRAAKRAARQAEEANRKK